MRKIMYSISLLCLAVMLLMLLVPVSAQAQSRSGIFNFFCAMVARNAATGPFQNQCLLQGQTSNNAANSPQTGNCPAGFIQTSATSCTPTSSSQFGSNLAASNQQQCSSGLSLIGINCVPICQSPQILNQTTNTCFTPITKTIPISNAGLAQAVTRGSVVTLDGTGSTATTSGATIVSYQWVQTAGPSVSLNGANTAKPVFIAPAQATTLSFSLTVVDSLGQTSKPASVTVTII